MYAGMMIINIFIVVVFCLNTCQMIVFMVDGVSGWKTSIFEMQECRHHEIDENKEPAVKNKSLKRGEKESPRVQNLFVQQLT